jgi:hypothetical protein
MTNENDDSNEVSLVRKNTSMYSEEYFSIHLKSKDENVNSLLDKAMNALSSSIKKSATPIGELKKL